MKYAIYTYFIFIVTISSIAAQVKKTPATAPLHVDDIHYIVNDANITSDFFLNEIGAKEMAHPGTPIDFIRFFSPRWMGSTITVTEKGPYKNATQARNQRWLENEIIASNTKQPVYGAYALCLKTKSLKTIQVNLQNRVFDTSFKNPLSQPKSQWASFFSVDGCRIIIHEVPDDTDSTSLFDIESIWMLVRDKQKTAFFFEQVFNAVTIENNINYCIIKVANLQLVLCEPQALGIKKELVSDRNTLKKIWLGIDHLGFLYQDVQAAKKAAEAKGYTFNFPVFRYQYQGKPTVYQLTSIQTPDDFPIELVSADGRIGPQNFYLNCIK